MQQYFVGQFLQHALNGIGTVLILAALSGKSRQFGKFGVAGTRQKTGQRLPIDLHDAQAGTAGDQQILQDIERCCRFECRAAHAALQGLLDLFIAGQEPHILNGSPPDAGGGQPRCSPVAGQGFQTSVGRHIVALAGVAEQGGGRGKKDKKIKPRFQRQVVEMEGAEDLGGEHAADLLFIHGADQAVVDHRGRMDDTFEGRHCNGNAGQKCCKSLAVSDVTGSGIHLHALPAHVSQTVPCLFGGGTAPADQYQVACSPFDQPLGGAQAETAQSSGHQVGRIGRQDQPFSTRATRRLHLSGPISIGDDDLADMPCLLHITKGVDDVFCFEGVIG